MRRWIDMLLALCFLLGINGLVLHPETVTTHVNSTAIFLCIGTEPPDNVEFTLTKNGMMMDFMPISIIDLLPGTARLNITSVPLEYNQTEVRCQITSCAESLCESTVSLLLVQGILGPVRSLAIGDLGSLIIISWESPIHLEVTGDITSIIYCVDVVNSTSSATLHSECGITVTAFVYSIGDLGPCDRISIIVKPVDELGNGTPSTLPYFLAADRPALISLEVNRDHVVIMMSAPVCNGKLTFEDVYAKETIVLRNSNFSLMETNISFPNQLLPDNRYYNVSIEASNFNSSVLYDTSISTHDIRNATVTVEDTGITIHTDYFEHSSASGALFIFVLLNAADLTGAVYLALDRTTSRNHTLPFSLSSGERAVFVYDIESDGTLASGVGYPAASREIVTYNTMQGQAFQSTFYLEDCEVKKSLGTVFVECEFHNGSPTTGFQMIVHKSDLRNLYRIYVNKTTDNQTSASILLEESGLYQVAIFPIGGVAGIAGSRVEYMEQIIVSVPATASTTENTTSTVTVSTTTEQISEHTVAEPNYVIIIGVVMGLFIIAVLFVAILMIMIWVRMRNQKSTPMSDCDIEETAVYTLPIIELRSNSDGELEEISMSQNQNETQATTNMHKGAESHGHPDEQMNDTGFQVVDAQYAEVKKPKNETQATSCMHKDAESHDHPDEQMNDGFQVVDVQYAEVKKPKKSNKPMANYADADVQPHATSSKNNNDLIYVTVDPVRNNTAEDLHEVSVNDVIYSDIKQPDGTLCTSVEETQHRMMPRIAVHRGMSPTEKVEDNGTNLKTAQENIGAVIDDLEESFDV